jgi:hypothetical protein
LRYHLGPDGKWTLYSVGPNQIDEGGLRPKSEPRNYSDPGDIVFSESDLEIERAKLEAGRKRP